MTIKQEIKQALLDKIEQMNKSVKRADKTTNPISVPKSVLGDLLDIRLISKRLLMTPEIDESQKGVLSDIHDYFSGFDIIGKGNIEDLCISIDKAASVLPDGKLKDDAIKALNRLGDLVKYEQVISKPGWDESENQWQYRIKEPVEFEDGSFRTVSITGGVSAIMGKMPDSDTMQVQALRFSKDVFETVNDAKQWLSDNPDIIKAGDIDKGGNWILDRISKSRKATVIKLNLDSDESVESFSCALRDAVREYAKETGKLGPYESNGYCPIYVDYIYDGYAIICNEVAGRYIHYRVEWKRDGKEFSFGEPTKVEQVVSFEPIDKANVKLEVPINSYFTKTVKKDNEEIEERFVIGGVLEPNDGNDGKLKPDSDDDIYTAADIRKAAHNWAIAGFVPGIGHMAKANGKISTVESFIAPQDLTIGEVKYIKGTWIMAAKINDDDLWAKVKKGELMAWSIEGLGVRTPVEVEGGKQ